MLLVMLHAFGTLYDLNTQCPKGEKWNIIIFVPINKSGKSKKMIGKQNK